MIPSRPRAVAAWLALACACAVAAGAGGVAPAATSGTVVGATVLTATNVDVGACLPGVAGRTSFGTLMPGAKDVTSSDCTVSFGSSNGIARLRVRQADSMGAAMWRPSDGVVDTGGFGISGHMWEYRGSTDRIEDVLVQPDGGVVMAGGCGLGPGAGDSCISRLERGGTTDFTWFGGSGLNQVDLSVGVDYLQSIALLPDGRIVGAAWCESGGPTNKNLCVARFEADGDIDPTFGTAGLVDLDLQGANRNEVSNAITVQDDGKLVVAGWCETPTRSICVTRLQANGLLDTAYGSGGTATLAVAGSTAAEANDVVLQRDGKAVVAGYCEMGGATGGDFCLARFTTAGVLDTTFGVAGVRVTDVNTRPADDDIANTLEQGSDRSLLAAGECATGTATVIEFCTVRYDEGGAPVASWGTGGRTSTAIGTSARARGALLQGDGKVVLTGSCTGGAGALCLLRLGATGALDSTFGTAGRIQATTAGSTTVTGAGVAQADDGAFIAGATCNKPGPGADDLCVVRFAGGTTLGQYNTPTVDWANGANMFAMCLYDASDPAPTWDESTNCVLDDDGGAWRGVPTAVSEVARAPVNTTNATAAFRFGVRMAAGQAPGSYVAPITFDVMAP